MKKLFKLHSYYFLEIQDMAKIIFMVAILVGIINISSSLAIGKSLQNSNDIHKSYSENLPEFVDTTSNFETMTTINKYLNMLRNVKGIQKLFDGVLDEKSDSLSKRQAGQEGFWGRELIKDFNSLEILKKANKLKMMRYMKKYLIMLEEMKDMEDALNEVFNSEYNAFSKRQSSQAGIWGRELKKNHYLSDIIKDSEVEKNRVKSYDEALKLHSNIWKKRQSGQNGFWGRELINDRDLDNSEGKEKIDKHFSTFRGIENMQRELDKMSDGQSSTISKRQSGKSGQNGFWGREIDNEFHSGRFGKESTVMESDN